MSRVVCCSCVSNEATHRHLLQGGSMPNTSSSVPFLLSSSMQSIRSRRPSACLSSSQGSGLLQQLGSGMVRQLSGSQVNGRAFPGTNVRQCPSFCSVYLASCLSVSGVVFVGDATPTSACRLPAPFIHRPLEIIVWLAAETKTKPCVNIASNRKALTVPTAEL